MEVKNDFHHTECETCLCGGPYNGAVVRYVGFPSEIALPHPTKMRTLCIYQDIEYKWSYVGMKMTKSPQLVTHRDLQRTPPSSLVAFVIWLRRRPKIVVGRPSGKSLHSFRGIRRGCLRFSNHFALPMTVTRPPYKIDWDADGFFVLFPNGNVMYRVDYL